MDNNAFGYTIAIKENKIGKSLHCLTYIAHFVSYSPIESLSVYTLLTQFRKFTCLLSGAALLLSIHPLLYQCLLLLLTWLTFLHTCPRPQLVIIIKGAVRGMPFCLFPWQWMSQPDVNYPYNWQSLLPPGAKTAATSCRQHMARCRWSVSPGFCFRCMKPLYPLSLWNLSCWLWSLFFSQISAIAGFISLQAAAQHRFILNFISLNIVIFYSLHFPLSS